MANDLGVTVAYVQDNRLSSTSRFLDVGVELVNRSPQKITAWQFTVVLSATDKLGRSSARNLVFECTDAPLAAGETRQPPSPVDPIADTVGHYDQTLAGYKSCTIASFTVNPYVASDLSQAEAIREGAEPEASIVVNRLVFADGSSLGTAVG